MAINPDDGVGKLTDLCVEFRECILGLKENATNEEVANIVKKIFSEENNPLSASPIEDVFILTISHSLSDHPAGDNLKPIFITEITRVLQGRERTQIEELFKRAENSERKQ